MEQTPNNTKWTKHFSNKYKVYYWFNSENGKSVWERPDVSIISENDSTNNNDSKKRRHEDISGPVEMSSMKKSTLSVKVAIIVPFRDIHPEQNRSAHCNRFIPEMTRFLQQFECTFRIYIIEQSNDGRRFNRGKLLNIGYDLAKKDGFNLFIFHDVDLMPSRELGSFYTTMPSGGPVHIARVWGRYSNNADYFGGIVAFTKEQYEAINGFPNNFWGWGGEDDEMMKRVQEIPYKISFPTNGSIEDMEDMSLQQKLDFLKANNSWKNMKKWELLKEHQSTWRTNGITNLQYKINNESIMNSHCSKYNVDILLNDHWTDHDSTTMMN